jgi:dTDP-4-amino-4,6-dideoxygalactose transaminase
MIPVSKPFIGEEEKRAVMEVMDSGMLVQGPRVQQLEEVFARTVGAKHAIATSSGTTALHIALAAHGIGPGDEVITTPFTFIASVNAILYVGATPIFCDIDEATFNLDVRKLEGLITSRTRAILPVHIYGQPCDMDEIARLASARGLVIVEDCAQAIGATYKGKHVGAHGTAAYSLYATKNVMMGEGGMITTGDEKLAELCRTIRQHGMRRRYYHDMLGYNFRATDLCAAIGIVQLGRLPGFQAARSKNAAQLTAGIQRVRTPSVAPDRQHAWHQYTVRIEGGAAERDRAIARLAERGVGTGAFYPVPAHRQSHLADLPSAKNAIVPVAERLSGEVFSLPVHPALSAEDLEVIVREVNAL